jgi:hypothetical protein
MSRICPVYASYLIRYGTSMEHLRNKHRGSIYLDAAVFIFSESFPAVESTENRPKIWVRTKPPYPLALPGRFCAQSLTEVRANNFINRVLPLLVLACFHKAKNLF